MAQQYQYPAHQPLLDPAMPATTSAVTTIIPSCSSAGSSTERSIPPARITASARHTSLGLRQAGRADPRRYLRLRYPLIPYIYSLGHETYETGAPFMRALFMDFPGDPNVADIARRIYVRPGLPGRAGDRAGATTARSISPPAPTGTTTGPTSKSRRPDHHRSPRRSTASRSSSAPDPSSLSAHPSLAPDQPQSVASAPRVSRRRRRLHPLLRRRHHLRLRKRHGLHHKTSLG